MSEYAPPEMPTEAMKRHDKQRIEQEVGGKIDAFRKPLRAGVRGIAYTRVGVERELHTHSADIDHTHYKHRHRGEHKYQNKKIYKDDFAEVALENVPGFAPSSARGGFSRIIVGKLVAFEIFNA